MGGVARNDTQHEVATTADHVAAAHFRPRGHVLFEFREHRLGLAVQPDQRVEGDLVAQQLGIELCMVVPDIPGLFERTHTAETGRCRNTGTARQLDIGDPALIAQVSEDATINCIEFDLAALGSFLGDIASGFTIGHTCIVSRAAEDLPQAGALWESSGRVPNSCLFAGTDSSRLKLYFKRRQRHYVSFHGRISVNQNAPDLISSCWILTDGKIGMINPCRGLAEVLGVAPVSKVIDQRAPWRWLPPAITPATLGIVSASSDELVPPWPDLLIASGRKSVAPARAIKRASRAKTFCVQVQNPGIPPASFDLVVALAHDGLSGENVISTTGSLHGLTDRVLTAARTRFAEHVAHLPRPLLAVLLGGDNAVYRMTEDFSRNLARQLRALMDDHGWGLAITPSRRTPAHARQALAAALDGTDAEIWDETSENPYLGYLAHADAIIVTGDSVNMVCEATATGKPVHVAHLEGGSDKFRRFHQNLEVCGVTRPFNGTIQTWDYEPLDDTAMVAVEIQRRIAIG